MVWLYAVSHENCPQERTLTYIQGVCSHQVHDAALALLSDKSHPYARSRGVHITEIKTTDIDKSLSGWLVKSVTVFERASDMRRGIFTITILTTVLSQLSVQGSITLSNQMKQLCTSLLCFVCFSRVTAMDAPRCLFRNWKLLCSPSNVL